MVFQPRLGTGALDDATHDHHGAQTAFGQVVGGRDLGPIEAGEEEFLFLAPKSLAKALGWGIVEGPGTKSA